MPRWDVKFMSGTWLEVGANALRIEGGALIFDNDDGVLAYGPGSWFSVDRSEA